jgi:hypothetical protein
MTEELATGFSSSNTFEPSRERANLNNFFGMLASPTGFEPVLPGWVSG